MNRGEQKAGYKVFEGNYYESFSWGAYKEINVIIIAENESQAHSRAVMEYPETTIKDWTFDEIPSHEGGVFELSRHD